MCNAKKSEVKNIQILTFIILIFTLTGYSQNKLTEKMEWLTTKIEYEGLPLYLRIPNYKNIWQFKNKYQNLVCITHHFDSIKENVLPTSDYNKSLTDFDKETIDILNDNGIIFLVETYDGARMYWFYAINIELVEKAFEKLKINHSDKKIELDISKDSEWNLITEYPVKLYKNE